VKEVLFLNLQMPSTGLSASLSHLEGDEYSVVINHLLHQWKKCIDFGSCDYIE
jgi:hypothetical protein